MKRKIHAFCGETGAGKTTISKRLAKEIGAFRISHDELLSFNYDQERLAKEHSDCCDRANNLAWMIVERIANLNIDVVLEGWGSRKLRDQVRKKAEDLNLDIEFYLVTCSQEERLKRIRKRNLKVHEDAAYISDEDFFRMEEIESDFGDYESFTLIENKEHNQAAHTTPAIAPR